MLEPFTKEDLVLTQELAAHHGRGHNESLTVQYTVADGLIFTVKVAGKVKYCGGDEADAIECYNSYQ